MRNTMFNLLTRFVSAVEKIADAADSASDSLGSCAAALDHIAANTETKTEDDSGSSGGGEPELSPAMAETLSGTRLA